MNNSKVLDRIQIIWDIKNIDEPTKSSIAEYIDHGFGKIDSYLKTVLSKTDASIKFKIHLEKKGVDDFIWGFHFNFPGVLEDFSVKIDENTPEKGIIQAVSELFEKAKNALQKKVEKLHDKPYDKD